MIFVGIDPGVSGAIALFNPETRFLEVHDMPTVEEVIAGKVRRKVDVLAFMAILDPGEDKIGHAVIEKVSAMGRDTPTTAFGLGGAYRVAEACLVLSKTPHEHVIPKTWQKEFAIAAEDSKTTKAAARAVALKLLPDHADTFKAASKDGRVDAALLAIYAFRKHSGRT